MRELGNFFCGAFGEFGMRVEPRAHGRAADGQIVEAVEPCSSRAISRSTRLAQPPISWPTVSGVASIRCVRPIFTTSANSLALASMA